MKSYSTRLRIAKNRLWKKISEYVRRKYADGNGFVKCYTCSAFRPWTELQCGHYIAQGNCSALEFTLKNLRPQCPGCNLFKSGNPIVYRAELCKEIGEDEVKAMETIYFSHQTKKWNLGEIEALEEEMEQKLMDFPAFSDL